MIQQHVALADQLLSSTFCEGDTTTAIMNTPLLLFPSSSSSHHHHHLQQGDDEARKPAATSFFQKVKNGLRVKFLMAGWALGSTVEFLLIVKQVKHYQRMVLVMIGESAGDTSSSGAGDETHHQTTTIQQRVLSFVSGLVWYELSYLCCDIFFAVYIFLLVRHVRKAILKALPLAAAAVTSSTTNKKQKTDNNHTASTLAALPNTNKARIRSPIGWEHAVAASNFLTGTALGVMATSVIMFGPHVIQKKLPRMILSIFAGTVACFLIKDMLIHVCVMVLARSWKNDDDDDDDDDDDEEEQTESSEEEQQEENEHQQTKEQDCEGAQEEEEGPCPFAGYCY